VRLIKIAVATLSPTVGAVRSNTDRLIEMASAAATDGATLACFPEQVIGGYPPEDLIQWRGFVAGQRRQLDRFVTASGAWPTVYVLGTAIADGSQLFNCAAVVHAGRVLGFVPKEKLPTYNVFYEERTFSRGGPALVGEVDGVPLGDYLFRFDFGLLAVEVCEDAWSPDGPARRRCYSGAEVVVNVSASPYRAGIIETRREMFATRSADNQVTYVYTNAVGCQDGLIFDGGGYIFQNGRLVLDAPRLTEGSAAAVVDLDRTLQLRSENTTWRRDSNEFTQRHRRVEVLTCGGATADRSRLAYPPPAGGSFFLPSGEIPKRSPRQEQLDEVFEVLALGVKDYFVKTGSCRCLGVALSGGRDSSLTLLVAWRAAQMLVAEHGAEEAGLLRAFYMPTRYSGEGTRAAAETLCRDLDVPLRTISIDAAYEREVEAAREMLGGAEPSPVTRQNVQARLRAQRMWNWANSADGLFLQSGDMSEKAVGYTTIGGDLEGGLSVIANLPKTVVIAMLERLQERFGFAGIGRTLDTVPGPELAADQTAEGELMPFEVLDACLRLYAGDKLTPVEVARALESLFPEHEAERRAAWADEVAELFTRSIYKWVQAPLSLHVGSLDLDRERALQLPVVQRLEWDREPEGGGETG
jgi:NAD+ synthase (glutamine-hydrolysing)